MLHPDLKFPFERVVAFCRRHQVKSLAVFGSAIRNDFHQNSDVDVLVEFEPGVQIGLFDYLEM